MGREGRPPYLLYSLPAKQPLPAAGQGGAKKGKPVHPVRSPQSVLSPYPAQQRVGERPMRDRSAVAPSEAALWSKAQLPGRSVTVAPVPGRWRARQPGGLAPPAGAFWSGTAPP